MLKAMFFTAIILVIRHVVFHNVEFSTFVWIAFSMIMFALLELLFSERFWYHVAWVGVFIVTGERFKRRYKDAYGEYGGDYDAP